MVLLHYRHHARTLVPTSVSLPLFQAESHSAWSPPEADPLQHQSGASPMLQHLPLIACLPDTARLAAKADLEASLRLPGGYPSLLLEHWKAAVVLRWHCTAALSGLHRSRSVLQAEADRLSVPYVWEAGCSADCRSAQATGKCRGSPSPAKAKAHVSL